MQCTALRTTMHSTLHCTCLLPRCVQSVNWMPQYTGWYRDEGSPAGLTAVLHEYDVAVVTLRGSPFTNIQLIQLWNDAAPGPFTPVSGRWRGRGRANARDSLAPTSVSAASRVLAHAAGYSRPVLECHGMRERAAAARRHGLLGLVDAASCRLLVARDCLPGLRLASLGGLAALRHLELHSSRTGPHPRTFDMACLPPGLDLRP